MTLALQGLRRCFEGAMPSMIATCAPDGTPNLAYLSQVHYVDESHVALTFQFFNSTRKNILANPRATVQVIDPETAIHYRLHLVYLRTEVEGPLFEKMKAKLAGIASHTGMSKVFRLLGSDIYQVLAVEQVPGETSLKPAPQPDLLSSLRNCLSDLAACEDLAQLFDRTLQGLERHCGVRHAMLLASDPSRNRLYAVATRGYSNSGIGAEIRIGEGIIGVAAREGAPIRIGYAAQEYLYSQATRRGFEQSEDCDALETAIPFPGLTNSSSQLAVPLLRGQHLLGVLYLESPENLRFTYADEDAMVILAGQLALAMELLSRNAEQHEEVQPGPEPAPASGASARIRHFSGDHSVFIEGDYLIKGVAGAILWKLVRDHVETGRSEFSNRELRLDPALRLPDICDNLEARLILLQRRLAERSDVLAIEKTGRGRFRLKVTRPLQLQELPGR